MKNERKHTPGPWEVDTFKGIPNYTPLTIQTIEKTDGKYTRIAKLMDCWDDEFQANARLIAAAPELLEACTEAYAVLSEVKGGLTPSFNAAYKCRNAIAKVKKEAKI